MPYPNFIIDLGPGGTGKTLKGQCFNATTGASLGDAFTAGFTELSAGFYRLTLSDPGAQQFRLDISDNGSSVLYCSTFVDRATGATDISSLATTAQLNAAFAPLNAIALFPCYRITHAVELTHTYAGDYFYNAETGLYTALVTLPNDGGDRWCTLEWDSGESKWKLMPEGYRIAGDGQTSAHPPIGTLMIMEGTITIVPVTLRTVVDVMAADYMRRTDPAGATIEQIIAALPSTPVVSITTRGDIIVSE